MNQLLKDKIDYYVNLGHSILDEKYWELWDRCVPIRLDDLYHGMELDCSLSIIKSLNKGCSLPEARGIIDSQNHSGLSFSLVASMVRELCDRGDEFYEYVR